MREHCMECGCTVDPVEAVKVGMSDVNGVAMPDYLCYECAELAEQSNAFWDEYTAEDNTL